jgi:hypothetical protein
MWFFLKAGWYVKSAFSVLLVLGTPSIEDLFLTYKRYRELYEQSHSPTGIN